MSSVVPHPFLMRYSIPISRIEAPDLSAGRMLGFEHATELPFLGEIAGDEAFARVKVGWNEAGIGLAMDVAEKTNPLRPNKPMPIEADGLQVWIDTRNTQNIHRASRFCHHFCLVAADSDGPNAKPYGQQLQIARAREDTVIAPQKDIIVRVQEKDDSYLLEAWLPAKILTGFDPEANTALGFYYQVRDAQLGDQFLTVDRDFPYRSDPSTWSTLELRDD